ncbi:MAG: response regulator [Planctomycetaceae bacterium]
MNQAAAASENAGAIAHRILVVEGQAARRTELDNLLKKRGYMVQLAKDGGQAHSAFSMYKPDFVILGLILKGETGFEICDRFKQQNETVPVLILTEIHLEESRNLADRVGADGYMTRPFQESELLETIHEIAQRVWERTHLKKPRDEKRIRFDCRCGKKFKVSPTHKGRTLTCPDCGEPLVVPFHD